MIQNDGVSLTSAAHPRLPWWKRPWSWLRCQRTHLFGFPSHAVERFALARCDRHGGFVRADTMIDEAGLRVCRRCAGEFSTEPFKLRVPVSEDVLSKWYGTKGQ